ncbi:putative oxidoreductase [Catalinimonas alkaloidigena]|uniref:aldo/keto reductase n=1 Tax=Catalinimonas alkaloidigena TaxID=1075417 RepID=UPI0024072D21|nr:aldo/keto reductase [Catalinimonas alkaloidigena]MDF9795772.1 putative oxidoreductase [Catalinimonas alkaloidigena]
MSVSRTKLCSDGPEFSRLVTGTWRLLDQPPQSSQETLGMIEQCVDLGITTFDEADIYGDYGSEALFGKALELNPSLKYKIEIVTKCGIKLISDKRPSHYIKHYDTTKNHIIASVENSLKVLGVDHIDLLLLHRPDPLMNPDEIAEAFMLLNEHGKVFHFGVSNFTVRQFELLQSRMRTPLVTNQLEASLLKRDAFLDGNIDYLMQHKKSPMAWSPFGGGSLFSNSEGNKRLHKAMSELSDKYGGAGYDQLALAWLFHHPANLLPILGTRKLERICAAAMSETIQLTREEWFQLWVAAGGQIP